MPVNKKRLIMKFGLRALVLVLGCLCGFQLADAQPAAAATNPVEMKVGGKSTNVTDTRYRIGPGDVLDVRVARAPELSRDAVRVDQSGNIRMPMLDNDIPAACLTEPELAQSIAKLYLKYKRDPHVDVFVKEFQSQPVAVIGAVRSPAQFKLQRQVRLLELISLVGGPNDTAGQTVQVVHAEGGMLCEQPADTSITENGAFTTYKLDDTLHGTPDANPIVRPGDIVSVPQADQIFVIGNVIRPTAIPLKEPLTVSKAIAMAGGPAQNTKKDKIRIIRQISGGTQKQEISVDLTAIEKNRTQDIALMANDVIDVPVSGTKRLLRSLVGAVVPTAAQLPVRVIP
jgi:polysaccharide biosynthesis/export protein